MSYLTAARQLDPGGLRRIQHGRNDGSTSDRIEAAGAADRVGPPRCVVGGDDLVLRFLEDDLRTAQRKDRDAADRHIRDSDLVRPARDTLGEATCIVAGIRPTADPTVVASRVELPAASADAVVAVPVPHREGADAGRPNEQAVETGGVTDGKSWAEHQGVRVVKCRREQTFDQGSRRPGSARHDDPGEPYPADPEADRGDHRHRADEAGRPPAGDERNDRRKHAGQGHGHGHEERAGTVRWGSRSDHAHGPSRLSSTLP